jgi:hypothetical protein
MGPKRDQNVRTVLSGYRSTGAIRRHIHSAGRAVHFLASIHLASRASFDGLRWVTVLSPFSSILVSSHLCVGASVFTKRVSLCIHIPNLESASAGHYAIPIADNKLA